MLQQLYPEKTGTVVARGKTKTIWATTDPDQVLIESHDAITAGDGARRDRIPGKDIYATETTCNCFALLFREGIPTHFIDRNQVRYGLNVFLAHRVEMIPLEVVVRRYATGSYLKRHRDVKRGELLPYPVEFFFKNDELHDPLVICDFKAEIVRFYDPKKPPDHGLIEERPITDPRLKDAVPEMHSLARQAFWALEKAWKEQNVTLVDLKVECGWKMNGELVIADVIDNDSWRIWPHGDEKQALDKQVYRDLPEVTPEALEIVRGYYSRVADMTWMFPGS